MADKIKRAETYKRASKNYYNRFDHLSLRISSELKAKLLSLANDSGESINAVASSLLESAVQLIDDGALNYRTQILPEKARQAFENAGLSDPRSIARFISENPGWCSGESAPRIKGVGEKTAQRVIDRLREYGYIDASEYSSLCLNLKLLHSFNANKRKAIIESVKKNEKGKNKERGGKR